MDTEERYRRFAEDEARGTSPSYERISLAVAGDARLLGLLDGLPVEKRQPNLLLAACRLLGAPTDVDGFLAFAHTHWPEIAGIVRERSTQTNEPARCATLLPLLAALPQPLALIEAGASAGLCLYPDRYTYAYHPTDSADPAPPRTTPRSAPTPAAGHGGGPPGTTAGHGSALTDTASHGGPPGTTAGDGSAPSGAAGDGGPPGARVDRGVGAAGAAGRGGLPGAMAGDGSAPSGAAGGGGRPGVTAGRGVEVAGAAGHGGGPPGATAGRGLGAGGAGADATDGGAGRVSGRGTGGAEAVGGGEGGVGGGQGVVGGRSSVHLRVATSGPVPVPAALPTVVWRAGVDLHPLDVGREEDLAWLTACIWPEHDERRRRLGAAAAIARADPPQLVTGDLVTRVPELIAEAPPAATTVVFHSAVLAYLWPRDRQRFIAAMIRARRDVVWVSNEGPSIVPGLETGARPPAGAAARAFFLVGVGGSQVAAIADPHGAWLRWLEGDRRRSGGGAHRGAAG